MRNIFVAIGGSGTKVAEALVRLMGIGFPLFRDKASNILKSAGGTLEFWVVDPDIDSAAVSELSECIKTYKELEALLGDQWATSSTVRPTGSRPLPGPPGS